MGEYSIFFESLLDHSYLFIRPTLRRYLMMMIYNTEKVIIITFLLPDYLRLDLLGRLGDILCVLIFILSKSQSHVFIVGILSSLFAFQSLQLFIECHLGKHIFGIECTL